MKFDKFLYRIFFVAAFILMISACSTNVVSLKADKDVQLSAEEGYLLIAINTNRSLKRIEVDGPIDIAFTANDLQKGSKYILANLPAGDYQIEKIRFDNYRRFEFDDDRWKFQVKPGVISYVGHLEIKTLSNGRRGYFELINQSSIALEYMEQSFPNLLQKRDIEFAGWGNDNFFDVIKKVKGATQQ